MSIRFVGITAMTLASALSFAQGTFDFYVADVRILQSKQVQAELKVTESQRAAMNQAAAKQRAELEAIDKKFAGQTMTPELRKQAEPQIQRAMATLKTNVLATLTGTQVKRLGQLSLQRAGLAAITDTRVAKTVGLSDAQLQKFRDAYAAGGKRAIAVQQAAVKPIADKYRDRKPKNQAEADALQKQVSAELKAAEQRIAPKVKQIEAETRTKLESLLTPAQRTKFKSLLGAPFKPK